MRRLTTLLTAITTMGGIALSGGMTASAGSSACSIPYSAGQERCFLPARAAAADRLMSSSVDPTRQVYQATHLSLVRVVVTGSSPTGGKSFQASAIQYVYGTVKGQYIRAVASPKFAFVWEYAGVAPRFVRKYYSNGLEVSPTIPQRKQPVYGPWSVRANFPHRKMYLVITANFNQTILRGLANAILHSGR